ncbi:hypothetical protein F4809DRAFT_653477 [Biscogniauxia mediterranea]|nr:hypothetical protein F4809DRAFT_653477 [Biscogniauxia mediterranea]
MIGDSLFECIFIRTCIFLLQYTTPLCLAALLFNSFVLNYKGSSALSSLSSTTNKILLSYSLLDIFYAIFIYTPYRRRLEQEAQHPTPLSPAARRALFYRCLDHIPDPRRYLRLWFLGADEAEMRRENMRDFFLWAFFDSHSDRQLNDDETAELDGYIDVIEQRIGRRFEPGRGKANGLRLTLDAIEIRYRSVGWYVIMGLIDLFTHCLLAWHGFYYYAQPRSRFLSVLPLRVQDLLSRRRSAAERLSYWYRPHTATDKLPVVFLHGIGIGLSTYMPYLSELNPEPSETEGQIGIIAIENLPISFRLTSPPLSKSEFLDQITIILATHGWDKFVLASHSYGTFLATNMLQSSTLGPQIESVVLIDPVSILLHLPDVAYNFTRRQPRQANEWQLWYFASMDPGVAHCLGRHFFWKDNIVWKEDLVQVVGKSSVDGGVGSGNRTGERQRRRVAVCLAERDLIVDTVAVARYLAGGDDWMAVVDEDWQRGSPGSAEQDDVLGRGHLTCDGIEILWFPGLDHAQAFDSRRYRNRLSSITRRYCAR